MRYILPVLFLFVSDKSSASLPWFFYSTISVESYGAIANDGINDYVAFKRVADTINARGGGVSVTFESHGQYDYRPPHLDTYPDSVRTNVQWDVFSIINSTNVFFIGNSVILKLMDSVPIGVKTAGNNAHIGSLFRFELCTGITVMGISGDGNMTGMKLLGNYGVGSNAYELEHDGVFILNSMEVEISNGSFNNFARDGIMFLENDVPTKNLNNYIHDCSFNGNGRNGMSFCGGNNLRVVDCNFIGNAKGLISENPGSGLDIEPERGASCVNSSFTRCQFIDNNGYSVTSGSTTETNNITFDKCKIYGLTNYAMYQASPNFIFKNTKFVGVVLLNFYTGNHTAAPYFSSCTFSDSLFGYKYTPQSYLVALGKYQKFDNCTFNAYNSSFCHSEGDSTIFNKPTFNAYFTKATNFGANCLLVNGSTFNDAIFRNGSYPNYLTVLADPTRNIKLNKCVFRRTSTNGSKDSVYHKTGAQ